MTFLSRVNSPWPFLSSSTPTSSPRAVEQLHASQMMLMLMVSAQSQFSSLWLNTHEMQPFPHVFSWILQISVIQSLCFLQQVSNHLLGRYLPGQC